MITIEYSGSYLIQRKKFLKNNIIRVNKVAKVLRKFFINPLSPGLNMEKLSGSDVWTIRIDKGNRIFFIWKNKTTVIFIDIGKHDKYRKY